MDNKIYDIKRQYTLFVRFRIRDSEEPCPLTMEELKERIRILEDGEILSVQMHAYEEP